MRPSAIILMLLIGCLTPQVGAADIDIDLRGKGNTNFSIESPGVVMNADSIASVNGRVCQRRGRISHLPLRIEIDHRGGDGRLRERTFVAVPMVSPYAGQRCGNYSGGLALPIAAGDNILVSLPSNAVAHRDAP